MKEYQNERYPEMAFYVGGKRKQFVGGKYATDKKEEIEVLDKLMDVKEVAVKKEEKPKSEKATTRKKVSEK